jgi:hypothetical protein
MRTEDVGSAKIVTLYARELRRGSLSCVTVSVYFVSIAILRSGRAGRL